MSPQEFWAIAEARLPPPRVGNMLRSEFDELRAMLDESPRPPRPQ